MTWREDPEKPKVPDHIFSADRPIASANADLLGRAPFAKQLATAVSAWRGTDSLVVGLYGTWGIGKSSIKNMVLEALRAEKQPLHVVEYNPWQWSGHDQVAEGFFSEIARILGRGEDAKQARKRELAWKLYAARLGVPLVLADGTQQLAKWVFGLGALLLVVSPAASSYLPQVAASTPFLVASGILVALSGLLWFSRQLFSRFATTAGSQAAVLEHKTLSEQKSELQRLLADLDRPVLVVIDDIDRLREQEIRLLFQLVKANADFPNVTYLLLFQRDIVEGCFESGPGEPGREFLEKIIQVGFDVPPVEPGRLYQALFKGLDDVLEDEVVAKRFDKNHWQNVFTALRPFFRNLRDVARFLGSFAFHVSLFRKGGSFEVNPVDLIALEALRVFEPGVYQRMKASKSALTKVGSAFGSRRDPAVDREVIETAFKACSSGRTEAVRNLLAALFPSVQVFVGGEQSSDGLADEWFRALRACHENVFDRYFLLALPQNDVSQADLDYLLENSENSEVVSTRLRQHLENGQIEVILDRLEAYKQSLPPGNIEPFLAAIMDVGDMLPEGVPSIFNISPEMHASRIIHWSLKTIADPAERSTIFRNACLGSSGIFLPLQKVVEQEAKQKIVEDPERYFVTDQHLKECKDALLARIREKSKADLQANHFLPYVLFRWKEWGNPGEAEEWAQGLLKRGRGVVQLLTRFIAKSTFAPLFGGPVKVRRRVPLKVLREFVPVDAVAEAPEQVDDATLDAADRIAVEAFHTALQRELDGKSENSLLFDDD